MGVVSVLQFQGGPARPGLPLPPTITASLRWRTITVAIQTESQGLGATPLTLTRGGSFARYRLVHQDLMATVEHPQEPPQDLMAMEELPQDLMAMEQPPQDLMAMEEPPQDLMAMVEPPQDLMAMEQPPQDLMAMEQHPQEPLQDLMAEQHPQEVMAEEHHLDPMVEQHPREVMAELHPQDIMAEQHPQEEPNGLNCDFLKIQKNVIKYE